MKNHRRHFSWKATLITLTTAAITTLAAANAQFPLSQPFSAVAAITPAVPAAPGGVPEANAGSARTVVIGETVTLDAAGSTNLEGERLTYKWTLQAPVGSGARLSDPTAVRPAFTVDLLGQYVAELVVSDGERRSEPATVTISTGNVAPVADAGADRSIGVGESVLLDAARSLDFNGDTLNYRWSVLDAPADSRAALANERASTTAFTADRPGDYVLGLVANDGRLDSAPATLRLSTVDARPFANAGADRYVMNGATVQLNGSASFDPDGRMLSYAWSLLYAPTHSNADLAGGATARPSLRTDLPGLYVVQLAVFDGELFNAADTLVIEARLPESQVGSTPSAGGARDSDGDGVPDDSDNCAEHFNPTQLDSNADGFGNRCDPDLDNDGFITNFGDLGLLKQAFFSEPGDANWNQDADFDGNDQINFSDLGIMKSFFFGPPGPIVIRFINPAGGSWHDPTNWSLGIVPTTIHTVRIDLDPGAVVEYSTGDTEIGGIRTSSPLLLSGGELSVTGDAQFDAEFTVEDGTFANANVLAPTVMPAPVISIPAFSTVEFDGVTLGTDVAIEAAAALTVTNNLVLSGGAKVTLLSNNSTTSLTFSGAGGVSSTLDGDGEVVFGGTTTIDNRNRIQVSGNGHGLVVAPGVTIRSNTSSGELVNNNNDGPLIIQGTVISNLASRVITVNGNPLTIEGALQVSNDGRIRANFGDAGTITAMGTATADTGELELFGDFTNEGTITVTDGVLDIGNAVDHEWDNNGAITLSNSTAEVGGSFMAVNVGNLTGSGTVIVNGSLDNTGQTVDLGVLLPGTVRLGSGGAIIGGSVVGTPLTLMASAAFTFDGVTLSTDLDIEAAAALTVLNDLMLTGGAKVTLLSNNSTTSLTFSGAGGVSSTLGGTGEVVLGGTTTIDNRNRITVSGSTHGLVVAPGVTIRTSTSGGQLIHNSSNGPVTIQGTVIADLASRVITLNGYPLTIEGTLQVSNDGRIQANFGGVGSAITTSGSATVNTGELELFGDFTNEGTITVTDGVLDIGNAVGDAWNNNGTITLSNSTAEIGGSFMAVNVGSLTGSGTVILNGTLDNTGQTLDLSGLLPGTVRLGNGGAIIGGSVVGSSLTLLASADFTLDGVTLAADLDIEAAAALIVLNDLMLSGGATVTLLSNNSTTSLTFSGAGGVSSTLGGTGEVVLGGTTTIDNRNRITVSGSTHGLVVAPGVTIRTSTSGGQLIHNSSNGPVTIRGTVIADLASRVITLNGYPLTIDGTLQISNDGRIQANFGGVGSAITTSGSATVNTGELELFGDFTNEGTITVTDGVLDIGNAVDHEWDNNGAITLSNSTAEVGGSFMAVNVGNLTGSGTVILNGTLDNTGQALDLNGLLPGTVRLGSGGAIIGGSVVGTPLTLLASAAFTFDGLTLATDLDIEAAATLTVTNDLMLSGGATVTLLSNNSTTSLTFSGAGGVSSTLDGDGEVVLGGTTTIDNRNRIVVSGSTHGLVVAPGVTIRTSTSGGQLIHSSSNGPVTIGGTVIADLASRVITLNGYPLTIEGSLQVSNDGRIQANFGGVGSAITASGSATVNTGELELFGDFSNEGTITVTDGVLDIGNAVDDEWDNNGTITLSNSTAELGGSFMAVNVGSLTGSGTVIVNGSLDNTGQTVNLGLLLPGTVRLGSGGAIIGGSVVGTPLTLLASAAFTFDGVTLSTDLDIEAAAALTVLNDLMLTGGAKVTLLSNNSTTSLTFSGAGGVSSTLGGTGEVVLGGTTTIDNRNRITVSGSTHGLVVEPGVTIRTSTSGGQLIHANSNGPVTIQGTVTSNLSGRSVTLNGYPLTIEGNLNAGAGSVLALANYALAANAVLDVDIGGLATAQFGRFTGSAANLDGTLNIALVNGFSPVLSDTFEVLSFTSRNGTFDTVNGTGIGGGLSFQVNYNATDVTLEVVN